MGVRPLDGLVAIAECGSRFEADAAVARLAAHGIEAMVLADPAAAIAPYLVTDRRFPVVVRIAIADDAQQVLARSGFPTGVRDPSPLVHPVLRPRPRPDRPPLPPGAPDPAGLVDGWYGSPDGTDRFAPAGGGGPSGDDEHLAVFDDGDDDHPEDEAGSVSRRRPRWIKPVAWLTAASVVLPLVASAVRALSQL